MEKLLKIIEENITILELEEYMQDDDPKAIITDYAILNGGYVCSILYKGTEVLENRTGWYWTKTEKGDKDARAVDRDGNRNWDYVRDRSAGICPALPLSILSEIPEDSLKEENGFYEFGELPKAAVEKDLQVELTMAFANKSSDLEFIKNGHRDGRKWNDLYEDFQNEEVPWYEYKGEKYARVRANFCKDEQTLSNGVTYKNGDYVWVKIEPVRWKISGNYLVTDEIIDAGARFNSERNYKGNFEDTDMNWYLKNVLFINMFGGLTLETKIDAYTNMIADKLGTKLYETLKSGDKDALEDSKKLIDYFINNLDRMKELITYDDEPLGKGKVQGKNFKG